MTLRPLTQQKHFAFAAESMSSPVASRASRSASRGDARARRTNAGCGPKCSALCAECDPIWVVAENVPGLRTLGADRVLADLEEAGYASWPLVVGAGNAGASHHRRRVFIVGRYAECIGCGQERSPETQQPGGLAGRFEVVGDDGSAGSQVDLRVESATRISTPIPAALRAAWPAAGSSTPTGPRRTWVFLLAGPIRPTKAHCAHSGSRKCRSTASRMGNRRDDSWAFMREVAI